MNTAYISCIPTGTELLIMQKDGYRFKMDGKIVATNKVKNFIKDGLEMKMQGIKFEKVSYEEFYKEFKSANEADKIYSWADDSEIKKIYDQIILPKRSTIGSAGYDFMLPYDVYGKGIYHNNSNRN